MTTSEMLTSNGGFASIYAKSVECWNDSNKSGIDITEMPGNFIFLSVIISSLLTNSGIIILTCHSRHTATWHRRSEIVKDKVRSVARRLTVTNIHRRFSTNRSDKPPEISLDDRTRGSSGGGKKTHGSEMDSISKDSELPDRALGGSSNTVTDSIKANLKNRYQGLWLVISVCM